MGHRTAAASVNLPASLQHWSSPSSSMAFGFTFSTMWTSFGDKEWWLFPKRSRFSEGKLCNFFILSRPSRSRTFTSVVLWSTHKWQPWHGVMQWKLLTIFRELLCESLQAPYPQVGGSWTWNVAELHWFQCLWPISLVCVCLTEHAEQQTCVSAGN